MKKSLSEQIYDYLKKDIIMGNINCGSKLTIKELEQQFNVSSTPVREALTRLSQEGLVDFMPNVGAKVKTFTLEDLLEITEICQLFDSYAIKKAMESDRYDELIQTLKKAIYNHKKIIDQKDFKIGEWYYNNYFHTAFYNFIDNKRIKLNAESYRAQFSMVVVKSTYNDSLEDTLKEHVLIYRAVIEKDSNRALMLLRKHFINGQKRMIQIYNKLEN